LKCANRSAIAGIKGLFSEQVDGGKTWQKGLFVNVRTGTIDHQVNLII